MFILSVQLILIFVFNVNLIKQQFLEKLDTTGPVKYHCKNIGCTLAFQFGIYNVSYLKGGHVIKQIYDHEQTIHVIFTATIITFCTFYITVFNQ